MNLDLLLNQKLDFITKGLSAEIKGAYNTSYGFTKKRKGQVEQFMPFYQSSLEDPSLGYDSPDFNKNIVYKIKEKIRACNMTKLPRGQETGIWKQV